MSVFRPGDVSYLRIPAPDPALLAAFYESVFGWQRGAGERSSFADASGQLIGHFMPEHAVAGEAGFRPYVYVESVEQTIVKLTASGGEILEPPYPEGNLVVATFRDPAGNVLGIWQRLGAH